MNRIRRGRVSREARPCLVEAPGCSEKDNLVAGRSRLRHPGERPRGSEPWQLALPDGAGFRTDLRAPAPSCADSCCGRGRLRAYLGRRRRSGRPRAYPSGSRRSCGQNCWPSAANVGWSLVGSRLTRRIPTSAAKLKNENAAATGILRCRGLPTMPGRLPRFDSNRSRSGIIRQRSAGPCSEIGVHKDELGD